MPQYFPFDPNPRRPAAPLPPGACDSQFHIFGPRERYPVRSDAAYEMPTATIERKPLRAEWVTSLRDCPSTVRPTRGIPTRPWKCSSAPSA
jgi:hypothetical protein